MSVDLTPLMANWRFLASGLVTTLLVSALSILLGAAIGLVVGAGRTYGGRWRMLVTSARERSKCARKHRSIAGRVAEHRDVAHLVEAALAFLVVQAIEMLILEPWQRYATRWRR